MRSHSAFPIPLTNSGGLLAPIIGNGASDRGPAGGPLRARARTAVREISHRKICELLRILPFLTAVLADERDREREIQRPQAHTCT